MEQTITKITNEGIIEFLATELMGWHESKNCYLDDWWVTDADNPTPDYTEVPQAKISDWNPLVNSNLFFEPYGILDKLKEKLYYIDIFIYPDYKIEVEISYSEKHPNFPKGRCYDVGDERVSLVQDDNFNRAMCVAIVEALGRTL